MINVTLRNIKVAMNPRAILTPAQKMKLKVLKEFGAYTRTVMRNSIKRARGPHHHAPPGSPPLFHDGGSVNYRDTIFFIADGKAGSVVIGGVLLSGTQADGDPVPGVLEHGGAAMGVRPKRSKRRGVGHGVLAAVAKHPHAKPAFDKAIKKKLPSLIAGGIMKEA